MYAEKLGYLTLHRVDLMSARGRRNLARWLRWHAAHLLKHGNQYAPRFNAGFTYEGWEEVVHATKKRIVPKGYQRKHSERNPSRQAAETGGRNRL